MVWERYCSGMAKSELQAEVRVDSLGRSIKRWVRKDIPSSGSRAIPKPKLSGDTTHASNSMPLDTSRMGTTRGWLLERLTPGNAKQRGALTASILNTAYHATAAHLSARGPGYPMQRTFQPGASIEFLDAMSIQALGHLDAALTRDHQVDGGKLLRQFNERSLQDFMDATTYLPEFEVLNVEYLCARGADVTLSRQTVDYLTRLRKSYDRFDRPDIFNMSERELNSAAEVIGLMERLRRYYPENKFPVRITHCILDHPGRSSEIETYLVERIAERRNINEDDADALREYLENPVRVLNEGML